MRGEKDGRVLGNREDEDRMLERGSKLDGGEKGKLI